VLTCEWSSETHVHPFRYDHHAYARLLSLDGIVKRQHRSDFQRHVRCELLALELLNIVRVRHPKSVLRGNLKTGTFARFHTLDAGLESRGQITIAKLKYVRLITDRGVHNVTAFQLKGKVHGDLAAMPHKKFCHKSAST